VVAPPQIQEEELYSTRRERHAAYLRNKAKERLKRPAPKQQQPTRRTPSNIWVRHEEEDGGSGFSARAGRTKKQPKTRSTFKSGVYTCEAGEVAPFGWSSLTVAKLRNELQRRGLDQEGKKGELVERLTKAGGWW
jgi:hypothetical protein